MYSRFIPPNPGGMVFTMLMIFSEFFVFKQIGKALTSPNFLNNIALPPITGKAASGPISPSPRTPIPSTHDGAKGISLKILMLTFLK